MKTSPKLLRTLLVSLSVSLVIVSATGCKGGKKESATDDTTAAQPNEAHNLFNADSAYSYIAQQYCSKRTYQPTKAFPSLLPI